MIAEINALRELQSASQEELSALNWMPTTPVSTVSTWANRYRLATTLSSGMYGQFVAITRMILYIQGNQKHNNVRSHSKRLRSRRIANAYQSSDDTPLMITGNYA